MSKNSSKSKSKNLFSSLTAVQGPAKSGATPLLGSDGTTRITEKSALLNCWAEHVNGVLNRPSSISDEAIEQLPQVPVNESLAQCPKLQKTEKSIKQLSNGKAPGVDSIAAEICKTGGMKLKEKIT